MQMMGKFRIGLLGIGGVGGYFGAKLAYYYQQSNELEIIFIARGENKNVIRQQGITLITPDDRLVAHPSIVSDDVHEIGKIDLLLCCIKVYQLEEALQNIRACIDDATIILPLLNGVDSTERVSELFPANKVWEGCVYVVSRLEKAGIVRKTGNVNALYFGSDKALKESIKKVEKILKVDGVNAENPPNILLTVWEKFLFISTMGTATSYLDTSIGEILSNKEHKDLLTALLNELFEVTIAKRILLAPDIIEQTINKMVMFPYEATSSMHTDFKKGTKTEVDSLTGYVVRLGKDLNVATPLYEKMYEKLKELEQSKIK
jgi:2-dehydropantoate 2-reductase